MGFSLERLVHAITDSLIQAQSLVEKSHISNLRSYFDETNKPLNFDIAIPSLHETDQHVTYRVPAVSLVPHSSLAIKEAKVEMDIEIGEISQDMPTGNEYPTLAEIISGKEDPVRPRLSINPEGGGVAKKNNGNVAKLTLELSSVEPPEGLVRMLNEIIKCQGRV